MKRLTIIRMVMAAIAMTTAVASYAAIPEGYYSTLKGKKGAELKTAVHNVIKNAKVLSYGSGEGSTWWGFYVTDNDNGYVKTIEGAGVIPDEPTTPTDPPT